MTVDASIRVESVVVEHATPGGPVFALDGVSFAVDAGASVAVTGPSGCGKSTLLGVLGALAVPTSGAVRVGDQEISSLPERGRSQFRRTHGFVYQADNLLPFLTVAENVGLQLALDGESTGADRSLELLDRLGLAGEAKRLPAIATLVLAGPRVSELCRLDDLGLDLAARRIRMPRVKSDASERIVPIVPALHEIQTAFGSSSRPTIRSGCGRC